jgi:mRNA interferase RelE/StbE
MGNSLNIKPSAEKELDALPWRVQIQILKTIVNLSADARPEGCKKLVGSHDIYRVRIGEYRVVYAIDDKAQAVYIESVGHRQGIYK